jgi:hypothetical protein
VGGPFRAEIGAGRLLTPSLLDPCDVVIKIREIEEVLLGEHGSRLQHLPDADKSLCVDEIERQLVTLDSDEACLVGASGAPRRHRARGAPSRQ